MASFLPGYAQSVHSGREQLIQKPTGCAHTLVVDLDLTVSEHHSGGVKYTENIPMDEPNKKFFAEMVAWLISKGVNVCIITRGISTLVIPWLTREVFGKYAQELIISSGKNNEGKVFEEGQVSVFAPTEPEFKKYPRLLTYVSGFLSDDGPSNIHWADKKVVYMNDYLHQVFEKEKELYKERTMSGSVVTFEDTDKGRFVLFTDDTQANVDAMSADGIKSIKAVPGKYVNNLLTIIGELPEEIRNTLPTDIIPEEKIIGITEKIIVLFPALGELKNLALIKSVHGVHYPIPPYDTQSPKSKIETPSKFKPPSKPPSKVQRGGKSKSKRKTKSKRKSKRKTMKK
jgi:hypothetical protein